MKRTVTCYLFSLLFFSSCIKTFNDHFPYFYEIQHTSNYPIKVVYKDVYGAWIGSPKNNFDSVIYTSPEIFYKHGSANVIAFTYGLSNSSTITNDYSIRSMRANITGMNLIVGKRMRIEYATNVHLGFDVYIGVSLRYRIVHETNFGSIVASYYHDESPNITIPYDAMPSEVYTYSWDLFLQFGLVFYSSW